MQTLSAGLPKPKKGESGYVCECKLCLQHKEIRRIQTLLPEEAAKSLEDLWSIAEHEIFDLEWRIHSIEEHWKLKYDELENRISNVLII